MDNLQLEAGSKELALAGFSIANLWQEPKLAQCKLKNQASESDASQRSETAPFAEFVQIYKRRLPKSGAFRTAHSYA